MVTIFKKLGPLGPIFIFTLVCFFLFTVNRLLLGVAYSDNLTSVTSFWHYIPVGLRMDAIILCLALAVPILLATLLPFSITQKMRALFTSYLTLVFVIFIFLEITSWPFLDQYSSRPNQLFFQYFTHPKEVFLMIWSSYKLLLLGALMTLFYAAKLCWKMVNILFDEMEYRPYWRNLLMLPILIPILIIGGRSGIGQANATPAIAAFSNDHITNQLALNATFSLSFAYYTFTRSGIRTQDLYGDMPIDEVISRVRKYMDLPAEAFTNPDIPTLHTQPPTISRDKPLNLVVIIMESLGSDFVESQNGMRGLTPNLDRLREEGVFFDDIYAIGTRTSRGIEALISGYMPTSKSSSIIKMDLAQHNFFTIAALLKEHGYNNKFIYGGEGHFDNMASFFLGNGFDEVIDENDFQSPEYRGSWGVSDEDTFILANEEIKAHDDTPSLTVILTMSNHLPFDIPEGKIEQVNTPKNTPENATKYSDYALGKFFEMAKKEAYYDNTVFLITADHPMRIRGKHLVPVDKFRIPALIIAPDLEPQVIHKTGSQIDLPTTAIGLLGFETTHPMTGRNLLKPNTQPGIAMLIYAHTMAFLRDNNAVIHQAEKKPQVFLMDDNLNLTKTIQESELEKDALAHTLFPAISYFNQSYRLESQK